MLLQQVKMMDEVQNKHDNVLAESPGKYVSDYVNIMEGETSMGDGMIEPTLCMQLKELKDMFDFYKINK